MALEEYRRKRRFSRTPEPAGTVKRQSKRPSQGRLSYVIQQHPARGLHYDFRLELDGVLKSWAVPRGPSLDPQVKWLAVETEDHPLDYGSFEGEIPAGEYGAGTVQLWDRGTWQPEGDPAAGYEKGHLKFTLDGEKLHGGWHLVRLASKDGEPKPQWLLIKDRDREARPEEKFDILTSRPESVASGLSLDELARGQQKPTKDPRGSKKSVKPEPGSKRRQRNKTTRASREPEERLAVGSLQGARRAALPSFIPPALASLHEVPPTGNQWVHEVKLDGYRIQCHLANGDARLVSRNNKDWTRRMAGLLPACRRFPADQAVLDGEVVVFAEDGTTSFQALQNAMDGQGAQVLVYCVFDLLYLDGYDLTQVPLEERKRLLKQLLDSYDAKGRLLYSEHLEGDGPLIFEQACKLGMEGVVSKRRDQPYIAGRSASWQKIKCLQSDEFIIVGHTPGEGSRTGF